MAKTLEIAKDIDGEDTPVPAIAAKNIHEAIAQVYDAVGYVQKRKSAGGLNYSFAGERDLIVALRPQMVNVGIYMSVIAYSDVDRRVGLTSGNKPTNITTLTATVRFTHAPSQTSVDVQAIGEGSDSSDKSGNKAMTCAFKYALRQLFCIETGDDPDSDQNKEHSNGHGPQTGANQSSRTANAPSAQTARTSQPALQTDDARNALAAAKSKVRQWISSMGAPALAAYEDDLRMLDNLTREDFGPLYRKVEAELAAFNERNK